MKKFKTPLLFALSLVPVTIVAGLLSFFYQYGIMKDLLDQAAAQVGGLPLLIAAGLLQTVVLVFIACFFGRILSDRLGLSMELKLQKKPALLALFLGLIMGLTLLADCWITGSMNPAVVETNRAGQNLLGIATGVIYGGIVEELLMRLFLMNLIAFALWKLFARKQTAVPQWALITANVLAAVLFAAGHLPATVGFFGGLTPLLVLRCFLLNGLGGLFFGWLYRKYALQYSVLSHMFSHIFFRLFFGIFF